MSIFVDNEKVIKLGASSMVQRHIGATILSDPPEIPIMFVRHTDGATIDIKPVLYDNIIRMCDRPLNNNWGTHSRRRRGMCLRPPFKLLLIVSDATH